MNWRLLRQDAALALHARLGVTAHQIDAGDDRAALAGDHLTHFASLALVTTGHNHDLVAFLNLGGHHSTSGASEMIFTWFLARSSRGTGPKMRVPTGSD